MSNELPETIHEEIKSFCSEGDSLAEIGQYKDAIVEYSKAWSLLPDPKEKWNASTWILVALADAYFMGGYKEQVRKALETAFQCPDAVGNPFIHLRYGQILLDEDDEDGAVDHLMRAYMGDGESVFALEDPKYLNFLKTRANL